MADPGESVRPSNYTQREWDAYLSTRSAVLQVQALTAENERLREALRRICAHGLTVGGCFDIAAGALSEAKDSASREAQQ